ncbi:unnamed protein product [Amoebophrya sp. A120]|nr:unnamed protein product [Amoebophrya sp. A120]|eukprot:GSA120T00019115001.1
MAGFRKKNQNKKNAKGLKTAGEGPQHQSEQKPADSAGQKSAGYELKNPLKGYNKVVEQQNKPFEAYYRAQNICENEEEFQVFMQHCRKGLPSGMRVNGTLGKHGRNLWNQFQSLLELPENKELTPAYSEVVAKMKEENYNGNEQTAATAESWMLRPKPLAWYPRELAYQFDFLDARQIKKDKKFKQLKEFLMNREQYGALQRQETVSMIPPHLLRIQPDDLVLDMCAAPGSKTCQMLEQMHWEACENARGPGEFSIGKGGVLANDVEWKRANMLTHQVQRIGSSGVAVLNTDAQFFPKMKQADGTVIQFDKVLCDVPCSGDGTIRKTPNIWRTWTLSDGLGLHFRQLAILWRGLDVLKVGGRLVYSTCSLNPMENESVINACLEKCNGSVKLVEDSDLLESSGKLVAKKGLTTWKVPHPKLATTKKKNDKEGTSTSADQAATTTEKPNEAADAGGAKVEAESPEAENLVSFFDSYGDVPTIYKESNKIRKTMFPPEKGNKELEKTRRFLPHLMNTGGFFVAILEKTAELPRQLERVKKQELWHEMQKEKQAGAASDNGTPVAAAAAAVEKNKTEDATSKTVDTTTSPLATPETTKTSSDAEPPTKRARTESEQAKQEVETNTKSQNHDSAATAESENKAPPAQKQENPEDHFYPIDDEDWASICNYYGFPDAARSHFYKRPQVHGDHKIYGISEKLRDVVKCCQNTGSTKVVSCGVRCFQMLNSFGGSCTWRITQQGLLFLLKLGLHAQRILEVEPAIIDEILEKREIPTSTVLERKEEFFQQPVLTETEKFVRAEALLKSEKEEAEDGAGVEKKKIPVVGQGSYVLHCAKYELHICVLVSRNFFTLYVDKQEAKALAACLKVGPDLKVEMGL